MDRTAITLLLALFTVQVKCSPDKSSELLEATMDIINNSGCLAKENVAMDEVLEFENNLDLAETNPQLKCFAACFMTHVGIMRNCSFVSAYEENKEIGVEDKELEEFYTIMESCKKANEAGERCECGYQMVKCIAELVGSKESD